MFERKRIWKLSVIMISSVYLSYRELAAHAGFVGGLMIGVLICSLILVWLEMFKSRKSSTPARRPASSGAR